MHADRRTPQDPFAPVLAAFARVVEAWPEPDPEDLDAIGPILDPFAAEAPLRGDTLVVVEGLVREAVALARAHVDALARAGYLETSAHAVGAVASLARHAVAPDLAAVEALLFARADWLATRAAEARLEAEGERDQASAEARYRFAQYYPGGAALLLGRYERGRDVRQPWSSGGPKDLLAAVGREPSRNAWCADLEMHRWAAERADRRRPEREVSMPEDTADLEGPRDDDEGDDDDEPGHPCPPDAFAHDAVVALVELRCSALRALLEARGSASDEALRAAIAELRALDGAVPIALREVIAPLVVGFRKILRYALASEPESADRRRLVLYLRFTLGGWLTLKALARHEGRPSGSVQCDMFRARRLLVEIAG
jgi:hypothetical protein